MVRARAWQGATRRARRDWGAWPWRRRPLVARVLVATSEALADAPRVLGAGEELGRGCFATCYEATARASGRAFCAKQLPKARLRQTAAQTLASITREAEILRRLQACPDVLRLHAVAEGPQHIYIVTEACRGGTLADHLRVREVKSWEGEGGCAC